MSCFDDLEQKVWPICNTVLGVIEDKGLRTPEQGTLVLLRQPRRLQKIEVYRTCIHVYPITRLQEIGRQVFLGVPVVIVGKL